ncbi:MAG: M20/M25/M40 family metallo-hydrolase, partial [Actinomycetota bacterium]|nr:M20/M25/M40 family metallo-hydrolase [Actinomycetota bacterium]
LGHLDTVVRHEAHVPLHRDEERLFGPGAVDMKGGVVLALGVFRAVAEHPELFSELCMLLVTDEEWRTHPFAHVGRFPRLDACLCFEAGERAPLEAEGVVVRRKAAGTLRVRASGRASHSGSAPDRGRNALLALADAALLLARHHEPEGEQALSVVPTVLRAGAAFNIVPASGELIGDLRAVGAEAFAPVLAAVPEVVRGVRMEARMERVWPGMDSEATTADLLVRAGNRLGRPITGVARGGASDASHFAPRVPLTVDGLGPRGGGAHTPGEFIFTNSLRERAEVALAVAAEVLAL